MLLNDPQEHSISSGLQHENNKSSGVVHVWVPVVPHYEVRAISSGDLDTSSKALGIVAEKHGLFAIDVIKEGTRIISEPPLITLPAPGHQIDQLMMAFAKLPKYDQDRVWDLDPSDFSASPLLEGLAKITEPILRRTVQIISKPKNHWTDKEENEFNKSGSVLERALETLRIASRWHAGCRSLINVPENERIASSKTLPVTGLFTEVARIRHSCVPNCYAHYNSVSNRMTVHTTRTIANGEELTLSSISNIYYQNAEDRAKELDYKFGINCSCEACNPLHTEFKTHENARTRAKARAILLNQFLTQVEIVDFGNVLNDLCLSLELRPEALTSQQELQEIAQSVVDLTKDLKSTGCRDLELVRWYNGLVDRIQPRLADGLPDEKRLLLWKVMLARANGCELIARRCLGEDTEEFEMIQRRRKHIELAIKKAGL